MLLTLFMSVVYMLYNHEGEIGFPFSDMILSKKQYAFSLMEHLIRLFLAVALLVGATRYLFAFWLFVFIEAGEVLDYVLTWGDPWFDSKVFTWNTIKTVTFAIPVFYIIGNEIWKYVTEKWKKY